MASDRAPATFFFMQACSHWNALKVVTDHARDDRDGVLSAAIELLAAFALENAFKAVLATSGWSPGALDAMERNLEACRSAAFDCGLVPRLPDETQDLVTALVGSGASRRQLAEQNTPVEYEAAVPIIGSLIVDVGEQFSSIGAAMGQMPA